MPSFSSVLVMIDNGLSALFCVEVVEFTINALSNWLKLLAEVVLEEVVPLSVLELSDELDEEPTA